MNYKKDIDRLKGIFQDAPQIQFYQDRQGQNCLQGGRRTLEGGHVTGAIDRPVVSIITIVRNGEALLEETIESVLNQDYPNIEYIIVDAGSSDGTVGVIRRYESQLAYWRSEPDRGIADGLNKGVALATGDLINFLNAGDYYHDTGVVSRMVNWYEQNNWWWAYGLARLMINYKQTSFSQRYHRFRAWRNLYLTPNCHQATFFRRELFQRIGLHITGNDKVADIDFFIRATKFAEPETRPDYLVWYDITGYSAQIGFFSLASRVLLTAKHRLDGLIIFWLILIFYRWCRSVAAFYYKRLVMAS